MKLYAEKVLDDCKRAFKLLEKVNSDEQLFRIYWLSSLVLLSTIGDVLFKLDCTEYEKVKYIWDNRFKELKDNKGEYKIFWEFIKKERNNVIHEYKVNYVESEGHRFSIIDNATIMVPDEFWGDADDGLKEETGSFVINSNIYRPMDDFDIWGYIDCRDLLKDAIDWWGKEISLIKKKI